MTDQNQDSGSMPQNRRLGVDRSLMRRRLPVQTIAIEVFSIVLGVFLALAVNQWREERANARQAEVALRNIEAEIRLNLEFLERIHDGNVAVVELLASDDADSDTASMSFIPGLQLRQTAWETAQAVGIFAHSDYNLIVDLAELYAMQNVYRTLAYQLTESMMAGAAFATAAGRKWDEENVGSDFAPYLGLLVQTETALIDGYRAKLGEAGDHTEHGGR